MSTNGYSWLGSDNAIPGGVGSWALDPFGPGERVTLGRSLVNQLVVTRLSVEGLSVTRLSVEGLSAPLVVSRGAFCSSRCHSRGFLLLSLSLEGLSAPLLVLLKKCELLRSSS